MCDGYGWQRADNEQVGRRERMETEMVEGQGKEGEVSWSSSKTWDPSVNNFCFVFKKSYS